MTMADVENEPNVKNECYSLLAHLSTKCSW